MIYVIYGVQEFLIDKEIKKIIDSNGISEVNKYNLEASTIESIINDCNSFSLFGDKKCILVDNAYIFTGTTNKKLIDQDPTVLEKYLNNPNDQTIVIFKIIKDKLDERKKIFKISKEKGYLKDFNEKVNINKLAVSLFGEYKISNDALRELTERVNGNYGLLEREIEKIKIYKDTDYNINMEDILNLTTKSIDTDIFNLIDNIINGNKGKAIESLNEMITLGEEPIMIIIMLSNQFRLIYQVKKLYQKGFNERDIISMLRAKWYPVKKASSFMNRFDDKKIINCIYQLSILDTQIKTGLIDKVLGLELFILNI